MARKRGGGDEGGGEGSWMNTYSDMVTLLLTFFVVLFSMSSVEEEKWEKLIKSFTNRGNETSQIIVSPIGNGHDMAANMGEAPLPADADNIDTTTQLPSEFDELFDFLKSYAEENNLESSVEITKEGDGTIYIRFDDTVFFSPDKFDLLPEGREILNGIGDALKGVEKDILIITVEGHTAAVEGYEKYPVSDWRLSGQRAASVMIYFEEEKGITPGKMMLNGYGKSRPIDTNATPQGRQKNRRVDMMIVSNQSTPDAEKLLNHFLSGTYDSSVYPKSGSLEDLLPQPFDAAASGAQEVSGAPDAASGSASGAASVPEASAPVSDAASAPGTQTAGSAPTAPEQSAPPPAEPAQSASASAAPAA